MFERFYGQKTGGGEGTQGMWFRIHGVKWIWGIMEYGGSWKSEKCFQKWVTHSLGVGILQNDVLLVSRILFIFAHLSPKIIELFSCRLYTNIVMSFVHAEIATWHEWFHVFYGMCQLLTLNSWCWEHANRKYSFGPRVYCWQIYAIHFYNVFAIELNNTYVKKWLIHKK